MQRLQEQQQQAPQIRSCQPGHYTPWDPWLVHIPSLLKNHTRLELGTPASVLPWGLCKPQLCSDSSIWQKKKKGQKEKKTQNTNEDFTRRLQPIALFATKNVSEWYQLTGFLKSLLKWQPMLVLTAGERCGFNEVSKVCRSHIEFSRCKGKSPALWAALAPSPTSLATEHSVTNKSLPTTEHLYSGQPSDLSLRGNIE